MKFYRYIVCAFLFIGAAIAETININWINDGETYAQTTCEIGGDVILPTTPTKRGHTFVGWASYTQLEYIESTGTQYIDTGIQPTSSVGSLVTFLVKENTSECVVMGARTSVVRYATPYRYGQKLVYGYNSYYEVSGEVTLLEKHTSSLNLYNDKKAIFDGTEVATLDSTLSSIPHNVWLFAYNYDGQLNNTNVLKGYIYNAIVTDGNNIVANFIPAKRSSDSAIGMYDTVSRQFFTNSGTGEFIAGPVAENQNFNE